MISVYDDSRELGKHSLWNRNKCPINIQPGGVTEYYGIRHHFRWQLLLLAALVVILLMKTGLYEKDGWESIGLYQIFCLLSWFDLERSLAQTDVVVQILSLLGLQSRWNNNWSLQPLLIKEMVEAQGWAKLFLLFYIVFMMQGYSVMVTTYKLSPVSFTQQDLWYTRAQLPFVLAQCITISPLWEYLTMFIKIIHCHRRRMI